MFFTNKHVVAALLIAPILAVLSYLAIDQLVGETPQAAQEGQAYPLVAKPNCRYTSGRCEFKNGELDIAIAPLHNHDGSITLVLSSNHPLNSAQFALAASGENAAPTQLLPSNTEATEWRTTVTDKNPEQQLQLVVAAADSLFYGEAPFVFVDYQTSFKEDFRQP